MVRWNKLFYTYIVLPFYWIYILTAVLSISTTLILHLEFLSGNTYPIELYDFYGINIGMLALNITLIEIYLMVAKFNLLHHWRYMCFEAYRIWYDYVRVTNCVTLNADDKSLLLCGSFEDTWKQVISRAIDCADNVDGCMPSYILGGKLQTYAKKIRNTEKCIHLSANQEMFINFILGPTRLHRTPEEREKFKATCRAVINDPIRPYDWRSSREKRLDKYKRRYRILDADFVYKMPDKTNKTKDN